MCTVSYLPLNDGYILTSNRDETPLRKATEVVSETRHKEVITFPRDPNSGGSWFAVSDSGRVACLLNGAFEPFEISQKYPLSRGTVLIHSFDYQSADQFVEKYDFSPTAPFTLLLLRDRDIHEIIWDGVQIHHAMLDPTIHHFWSSVTLYPPDVRTWRRELFHDWVTGQRHYDQDAIIGFHKYGGKGDEANDFVMNRGEKVKTLSISSVEMRKTLDFRYLDLSNQARSCHHKIELRPRFAISS